MLPGEWGFDANGLCKAANAFALAAQGSDLLGVNDRVLQPKERNLGDEH